MAEPPRKVYWDACAWIGFINAEPGKLFSLRSIWEEAQRGKYQIWTSVYSYLEVYKAKDGDGSRVKETSLEKIEAIFSQDFVERVQLDSVVAKLARDLRIKHDEDGLSNRPDAIHLATAVHHNLEELHTWDQSHLLGLNGKINRRDGVLLPIIKPAGDHVAGPMFEGLPGDDVGHHPNEGHPG